MNAGPQAELNFSAALENPFRRQLNEGAFTALFEVDTPSRDCDPQVVFNRVGALVAALDSSGSPETGLAIADRQTDLDSMNVAEFAAGVCKEARDRHIVFLSGKNASFKERRETISGLVNNGFHNIVPVTGERLFGETPKETRRRRYLDSVDLLRVLAENDKVFSGCVVSPFKYNRGDCYPQYYKLCKKLNHGARFIVTQAGWDLKKHQELRTYLENRDLFPPALARFILLTPERVERVLRGEYPGVYLSPDFLALLRREAKFSEAQFMAAQWRRLQYQVAGARLLGYTGVVFAGVDKPQWLVTVTRKIREALKEFPHYGEWREAYSAYLARAEMAPYPLRFYMYDDLLAPKDIVPAAAPAQLPECSRDEKIRYRLSRLFFSKADRKSPRAGARLKKILHGCVHCQACRLPLTQHVCPETCPKGLANGPCGGTRSDGRCEVDDRECAFGKMFRIACWRKDIPSLEERYIPPVNPN